MDRAERIASGLFEGVHYGSLLVAPILYKVVEDKNYAVTALVVSGITGLVSYIARAADRNRLEERLRRVERLQGIESLPDSGELLEDS